MLGDEHEAAQVVLQRMQVAPPTPEEVYDEMLVPTLNYTNRDVQRGHLTDDDQRMVLAGMRQCLSQADEFIQATTASKTEPSGLTSNDAIAITPAAMIPATILGCPAKDDTDSMGLEMLRQLLDPSHWDFEVAALEALTSELTARMSASLSPLRHFMCFTTTSATSSSITGANG